MPGAFMTEHEQGWIRRRKLHMTQPGVLGMDFFEFCCGQVDSKQVVGEVGIKDSIEELAFIGILPQDLFLLFTGLGAC